MPLPSISAFGKILGGTIFITACLVIVVGMVGYFGQIMFVLTQQQLAGSQYEKKVMEINRDITTARFYATSYAMSGSTEDLATSRIAAENANREIYKVIDVEGQEGDYYQDLYYLQALFQQYVAGLIDPLVSLRESFDAHDSVFEEVTGYYIDNSSVGIGRQLEEHVRYMISASEDRSREMEFQVVEATELVEALIKWFGLVIAGLSLLVIWNLVRQAHRNAELEDLCKQVATGETLIHMKQINNGDMLAIAVNAMITSLHRAEEYANGVAGGDIQSMMPQRGENDRLAHALNNMTQTLQKTHADHELRKWNQVGLARMLECMGGDLDLDDVGTRTLAVIVEHLDALVGTFYVPSTDSLSLTLVASHALTHHHSPQESRCADSGLLGQAIIDRELVVVRDLPADYLIVGSALGETTPREVMLVPVLYRGQLMAALELATLGEFTEDHQHWMHSCLETLAVALFTLASKNHVQTLFETSQEQALLLQHQQQKLESSNAELSQQAEHLRSSEEELRVQSQTLQLINAELEEKNESLDLQAEEMNRKNHTLELIQADLEERSAELEISGKYKSEFLANMSHELRTPLNSLLLLSRSLLDNDTGNLCDDQLESVGIINKGGKDLLRLINDILDLSRVESGKLAVVRDEIRIADLADSMRSQFRHVASDKGLDLTVEIGDLADVVFFSDIQRVEQILKNLLSNALKFTLHGSVTLSISSLNDSIMTSACTISAGQGLVFSVRDTGIGIPDSKVDEIWEAFQQADGTTSRNFGGTGLGLAISRQLAVLLGGCIELESEPDAGSSFTLALPLDGLVGEDGAAAGRLPILDESPGTANKPQKLLDDGQADCRAITGKNAALQARKVLLVDDDIRNSFALSKLLTQQGMTVVIADDGKLAIEKLAANPDVDIVLMDIMMPVMDGYEAIEIIRSKGEHLNLPIIALTATAVTETRNKCLDSGANDCLAKPLDIDKLFSIMQIWLFRPTSDK